MIEDCKHFFCGMDPVTGITSAFGQDSDLAELGEGGDFPHGGRLPLPAQGFPQAAAGERLRNAGQTVAGIPGPRQPDPCVSSYPIFTSYKKSYANKRPDTPAGLVTGCRGWQQDR